MTNIPNSDVYKFIEYVRAMPLPVYHLARSMIHGTVKLYDLNKAADFLRHEPDVAAEYDFVGVLAGFDTDDPTAELTAVLDEATKALVSDFYATNSPWIPVSERLPDECNYYLIYYGVVEAYGSTWWGGDSYPFTDDVTHWMPLPDPPEVEP